ncbi:ABC transporter ATP-binding protein [Salinilacihabitans rarus]|uniref:ABC transporter ATP-binding protein n=1 Tax=Salinilacihabitans rarus TaxID=2961596 RepID=UPI0020C9189C|nr:ABC transporter ATP-binding protein [Salinilacihabitans rarus]
MSDPLLTVDDLRVRVDADDGPVQAVDGVGFRVDRGETVCLVGDSGSGKTVTCESITGLRSGAAVDVSGEVRFDGRDLLALDEGARRRLRGDRIAYAFQNPRSALDPVYTVGDQIVEAVAFHRDVSDAVARERAVDLLRQVGISRARERVDRYPHEFSDGMCQRVGIAIALAAEPELLIADEPTSALDVTIQARLIELLDDLRRERALSMLLVTHDLRVVAALADRVVVLYEGAVVERGPVERVFDRPAHPYTRALFRSFAGEPTDGPPASPPDDGCRFRAECPHAIPACEDGQPPLEPVEGDDAHRAACVYHGPGRDAATVLGDDATARWEGNRD